MAINFKRSGLLGEDAQVGVGFERRVRSIRSPFDLAARAASQDAD